MFVPSSIPNDRYLSRLQVTSVRRHIQTNELAYTDERHDAPFHKSLLFSILVGCWPLGPS